VGVGVVLGASARLLALDWDLTLPGAVMGFVWPRFRVREVIRTRVKVICRALPQAIESVSMCMGAGLDFPGSLRMLLNAETHRDALVQEFESILEELELGHTRREALLNFAGRVQSPAVHDFVRAIVQAEQKGNPLARALRIQGLMLRLRRSVAAEEAAARAAVLMIGPMMLLLGCILLLLMGPFLVKGVGI
jgi:tight adherence protein C